MFTIFGIVMDFLSTKPELENKVKEDSITRMQVLLIMGQ